VRMTTELGGCDIYYTFDGTNPDQFATNYAGPPVPIPGDASVIKATAWRGGHPSGRILTLSVK
jgi:hexosaminidase